MRYATSRAGFGVLAVLAVLAGAMAAAVAVAAAPAPAGGQPPAHDGLDLTAALADDLASDPGDGEAADGEAGAAAADPAPRADIEALRRRIAEIVARAGGPGAAVVVIGADGTRLLEGFGPAGAGAAVDAGTLFRVGSVTKSFLALAVMRLVEQGKLRLEDRIRTLAPEIAVKNRWEKTHPLQVAHLLEHTSGFDEMRFNEMFDDHRAEDRPLAQVLAVNSRSRVARWPPGTRHSYSQPGYTLAAYLIEKVSGMPYERYLEEQVFVPLGIRSASLRLTPAARARLAPGFDRQRPQPYVRLLHRPALNLMISAADLSRLLLVMLNRGTIDGRRFLTEASIDRIERSGTLSYGPPTVRYGLGNWGDVGGPVPTRGHGGFMPGYLTLYRYSPARHFGYAVMVNDPARAKLGSISNAILRYLLAASGPIAPPVVPEPTRPLRDYAGSYQLGSPNIEFIRFHTDVYQGISIAARGGRLRVDFPDRPPMVLVPSGPDQFRQGHHSGSSVQFIRTAAGRRAAIIGQSYYEEEAAWWAWARRAALELSLLLIMSTVCVPLLLVLRARRAENLLLLRPFLTALCLLATSTAFDLARGQGQLGEMTVNTVMVWVSSWAFAFMAYSGFSAALRPARQQVHGAVRAYVFMASAAAVWVALHLSRYGLIGVRTWRW
jgi:CubicO group peptidase (beta-lactamase class C family)